MTDDPHFSQTDSVVSNLNCNEVAQFVAGELRVSPALTEKKVVEKSGTYQPEIH